MKIYTFDCIQESYGVFSSVLYDRGEQLLDKCERNYFRRSVSPQISGPCALSVLKAVYIDRKHDSINT